MKKIGLILFAVCFISGIIVASANAQMYGGKGKEMGMWGGTHLMHIINKLGLDDNQTKEVKAVVFKLQKEMIQKRAAIQVARIELREILDQDTVDMKAVASKVKQIESLRTEAIMMRIQGHEDIKVKLTPEQKKKLSEMMQMRRMWHAKRMMHSNDMDCPKMKGMMDRGSDTGTAKPVKNKAPKAFPPAQQQN
jgi:Spy/CpxP family protein refolding chaperone